MFLLDGNMKYPRRTLRIIVKFNLFLLDFFLSIHNLINKEIHGRILVEPELWKSWNSDHVRIEFEVKYELFEQVFVVRKEEFRFLKTE